MKGYIGVLIGLCVVVPAIYAGCMERGCCQGKDNKCKATGPRMRPIANKTDCFCDETCHKLEDCCTDYSQACVDPANGFGARDCVLEDWGEWSKCDADCGQLGSQTRERRILQNNMFGGEECKARFQRRSCRGQGCARRREEQGSIESETGSIIPAEFGQWRSSKLYNPYLDIRKNIWQTKERNEAPSYKTTFRIVETRPGCTKSLGKDWANVLRKDELVCVECQADAMKERLGGRCKGHGAYLLKTGWKAVTVPHCHGRWEMVSQHEQGHCDPRETHSFILI